MIKMHPSITKKPFFCNYWVTYRCNSRCGFCNFWRDKALQNMQDVEFRDAKKNLDDLKKMGVRFIDFTGGEPLLNGELAQMLAYAKKLGFFVKLSTNGYLYPEKAEELKDLPSRIYFSFDTTSKDEYKKIRGIDGYNKLIESIEIAKGYGQDICLLYTVTDENIKNISDIVNFAQNNKIVVYIHPCFSYFDNKPLNKSNIDKIQKYFWYPYVRMSLPQLDFHKKGGNTPSSPSCQVGVSTIDIGPDDCLTIPCTHKHIEIIKINGKLFSLYQSKEWNQLFKNAGTYDFCNHCTIDCYFGMSYFDRLNPYFIKQNLTYLKNFVELMRSK
ncbi:MAG: radical SAM protein [Promethearchaeota archaeon]